MSASVGEVARPTLRVRGLLGQAEPILITEGRAVADYREAFVGIDVAKLRNAIADSGREGEVRFFGEVDASDQSMRRVIQRIVGRFDQVHFCYEAGPTGYGLYRLIRSLGHECMRTPAGFEGWVHGGYVQMIDPMPAPGAGTVPDPIHERFDAVRGLLDRMLRNMASELETYT